MTDSNTTEKKTRNVNPRNRAVTLSNLYAKEQARAEGFQARADESTAAMDAILAEVKANPELLKEFSRFVDVKSDEAPASEDSEPVATAAE